jgi:hypothetical protein
MTPSELQLEIGRILDEVVKEAADDVLAAQSVLADETARGATLRLRRYWQRRILANKARVMHLGRVRAAWAGRAAAGIAKPVRARRKRSGR